MKYVIGIALAVLAIYVLVKWEGRAKRRKIEKAFSGREALLPEQFYERYFAAKGVPFEVANGVREVLTEQLDADLSRLIDADDFSKNLSFFWSFDSMASVEIVIALENKFSIKIEDVEAERARTVGDIIQLVCEKIKASHA